ncbi:hypothetical protein IAT40_007754 [Kwoniella sp. CBS 6097]
MLFPPTTSFTPLSTIPLPSAHILHPKACNPSMDLIVLLSPASSSSSSSSSAAAAVPPRVPAYQAWNAKGKGKDIGAAAGEKTGVSLWRTGGSRVWEVQVAGKVGGLAWSEDGLFLSILTTKTSGNNIEHLSVHTGEVIRSIPLDQDQGPSLSGIGSEVVRSWKWVDMEWRSTGVDWEEPRNGSALMILDSLPRVTPVELPKPTNTLPFQRPTNTAPIKPTIHPLLSTFPALLPSDPPVSAHILTIGDRSFLTGTFPLSIPPSRTAGDTAVLGLAQSSDRMVGLLDIILRGLENAEQAFRDGEKQTMICREDLETCAQQQAMTIPDVHADLFRFLMTGRSGVAVNEWLGNRLTGRTIAKWDQMLDTSFRTIQSLISESISPALERIILLLEELKGWSKDSSYKRQLDLDEVAITSAIDLVLGFAKLVERMRRDAEHEMLAAAEFMKWLKYEITRAAIQDPSSEDLPNPTHDLKLVWSFMQNGFVHSSFHRHFPNLLQRPPKDCLPDSAEYYPRQIVRRLSDVLKETSERLNVHQHLNGRQSELGTPLTGKGEDESNDSTASMSMSMSMSMIEVEQEEDHEGDITPIRALSPTKDLDDLISRASSPDTVEQKDVDPYATATEEEIKRFLEDEPWVWANTLVRDLNRLVKSAVAIEGDKSANVIGKDESMTGLRDTRQTEAGKWEVLVPAVPGVQQLWLRYTSGQVTKLAGFVFSSSTEARSTANDNAICLAVQFFDDEEIVLLLQSNINDHDPDSSADVDMGIPRYLVTVRYADFLLQGEEGEGVGADGTGSGTMSDIPLELGNAALDQLVEMGQSSIDALPSLPICRCRHIGSTTASSETSAEGQKAKIEIALNGRKGRRLGCVIQEEGTEIQVWDLDIDEDEDEDEEEEEDADADMGGDGEEEEEEMNGGG